MKRTHPISCLTLCLLLAGTVAAGCHHGARSRDARDAAKPPSAHALFRLGMQHAAQQDLLRAQQYLEAAVAAGYPESSAIIHLVEIQLAGSQVQAAMHRLQQHLQHHPDAWQLRYLLATLYAADGQSKAAAEEARLLVEQAPERSEGHCLLATLLRDQLGKKAALQHFRTCLALAPRGTYAAEALAALKGSKP